jgi:hypothetical protein
MKFTDKDNLIKTSIVGAGMMTWQVCKATSNGFPAALGIVDGAIYNLLLFSFIYPRKIPAPRMIKENDLLYLGYRICFIFGVIISLFSTAHWRVSLRR